MRQITRVTEFDFHPNDCLAAMPTIADSSVDLIVTSPPYNLGIAYSKYRDRRRADEYLSWCERWAVELQRVLKADGSLFLNLGAAPSNPLLPHEVVLRLRNLFVLQNTIHWIKSIALPDPSGATVS